LNIDINLLDLSPAYPKEPKTLGERLRRARMDKNMLIREFAEQIGVTVKRQLFFPPNDNYSFRF